MKITDLQTIIKKAQETGEFKNHPEIFQFSEGMSLENIIYKWWDDMEKQNLSKISVVDELIRRVRNWLPETEEFDLIRGKLKND